MLEAHCGLCGEVGAERVKHTGRVQYRKIKVRNLNVILFMREFSVSYSGHSWTCLGSPQNKCLINLEVYKLVKEL